MAHGLNAFKNWVRAPRGSSPCCLDVASGWGCCLLACRRGRFVSGGSSFLLLVLRLIHPDALVLVSGIIVASFPGMHSCVHRQWCG